MGICFVLHWHPAKPEVKIVMVFGAALGDWL